MADQLVASMGVAGAAYWPLLAKMSDMCSLSHSSSLRTEKPKSSSSCATRVLDWWRSSRSQPAEPIATDLLRAVMSQVCVGVVGVVMFEAGSRRVGGVGRDPWVGNWQARSAQHDVSKRCTILDASDAKGASRGGAG